MNFSVRLYGWLLVAYPLDFRREFGNEMLQVFRDCYRAEARSGSVVTFWFRTLLDLVLTAAKERADNSGRDGVFMNRRSDVMVFLIALGIIVIGFVLHRYGVRNNTAYIALFGYVLDAIVSTGIVGNLIVFVLYKTTKLNPLRTALITFAAVHALLFLVGFILAAQVDPSFRLGPVVLAYVVSFLFWTGLHWAWQIRAHPRPSM
jgi:hypothetical protein